MLFAQRFLGQFAFADLMLASYYLFCKSKDHLTFRSSDSPAYFMKIKSIAPKTATSRPNTPITQFSTPKPPVSDTTSSTSSKVKLNPLPLSELADDAFKFVPDKKEETEEEVRSSEEEEEDLYKIKRKKRKRKKKELDEIIVAEIIVEELDHSDPKIIEECEDMDG